LRFSRPAEHYWWLVTDSVYSASRWRLSGNAAEARLRLKYEFPTLRLTAIMHVYEVRPRKDHRGVDLISDVLPFGRLWYGET
jgi:hypothetical protein